MIKIAAIIGGVLLMAGVALAGTLTSLDSTNSPTIGTTPLPAVSTVRQENRAQQNEQRGRANEPGEDQRGRANEPGEDLRGPCDEPEHANDARCTGAPAAGNDDNAADNLGDDDSANSAPGPNSGPSDRSGHDGGSDDNSGHGGGGNDD